MFRLSGSGGFCRENLKAKLRLKCYYTEMKTFSSASQTILVGLRSGDIAGGERKSPDLQPPGRGGFTLRYFQHSAGHE
jgi:chromosome condensin MukBEF ATPase and DNA-binding subunit MukB